MYNINNKLKKLSFIILLSLSSFTLMSQNSTYQINYTKLNQLMRYANEIYVDTINFDGLVERGVVEMLKELDPHSTYIPAKDLQKTNEPLQGAFDGIGVTFQLIKDTINVMEVIVNGPSEKVGLMAGDKIVKVDTTIACGKHINNSWVQSHLRGKKGTKVTLFVKRGRKPELLEFTITRDKIPMNSINVFFMVNKSTGYIRLERFSQTTPAEFNDAITRLEARGMENLIFDLRGNGGGYLDVAFQICDEFITKNQMIVYTDNFRKTGKELLASEAGHFEKGKLIILVDEGSASASEIVSGCVQDWDRGLVIGRRTFGKGLVQQPLNLADGSQIRLTISRYYTPTGRCIQKPYDDGLDNYYNELYNRSKHGELLNADSISFPDSLKYLTPNGRTVYGGGGIMPDIFIPIDTTKYSTLFNELIRKGVFGSFTMDFMENHRQEMKNKYPTIKDFKDNFEITDELYNQLMDYAKKEGITDSVPFSFSNRAQAFVKKNSALLDSIYTSQDDFKTNQQFSDLLSDYLTESYNESMKLRNLEKSPIFIKEYLKFEIARTLYTYGEAYQIFLISDETFLKAVEIMDDNKVFKKFKVEI